MMALRGVWSMITATRSLLIPIAAVAFAVSSARSAQAQELSGTLRYERTGVGAAGVLVIARRTVDGNVISRVVTSRIGRYRLVVGTDSVEVVALRIGMEPSVLARVRLRDGEQRELDAVLAEVPIRLSDVRTRATARCEMRPNEGSTVAQLFLQARTALLLSRLRAQDGAVTARYEVRSARSSARGQPIGTPVVTVATDSVLQPFRSVPVDSLATIGFRTIAADGAMTYRAPDADVLTSDAFLAHYCLQLVAESPDYPAWIGVAFRPSRNRLDIIQTRGVVWLDRASSELRQIDFGYVGLEPLIARASPGGTIAYTRLDDEIWFVHEWGIRMPTVASVTRLSPFSNQNNGALDYVTVTGTQTVSGAVLELRRGNELLFSAGARDSSASRSGIADDALLRAGVANRDALTCADSAGTQALVTGVVLDASQQPRGRALVRATWVDQLRSPGGISVWRTEAREAFTHTDTSGRYLLCNLPRDRPIRITVTKAGGTEGDAGRSTLRLRRESTTATLDFPTRK